MIIIWRGWGLLAAFALVLPLAVCGTLADKAPGAAPVVAGLALAAGGVWCWVLGRRWNQGVVRHSLYFVPSSTGAWRTWPSGCCSPPQGPPTCSAPWCSGDAERAGCGRREGPLGSARPPGSTSGRSAAAGQRWPSGRP
jgi:hypothetical protein